MEGCSEETTYVALDISEQLESEDPTVPPFSKAKVPSEISLILYLDKEKPLSEPRWVKTGDVQEWLRSMFGRMFWVAGDAADGWERRIEVADPDPVRTADRAVPLIHIPTNVTRDRRHRRSGQSSSPGRATRTSGRRQSASASSART